MSSKWEGIYTIAQIVSSIATFSAVIIALKQGKPKVKVKIIVGDIIGFGPDHKGHKLKSNMLLVTAVNVGTIPVKIENMGLRLSRSSLMINPEIGDLPKVLMPSEDVSVKTSADDLNREGLKRFDLAYASDSSGRVYYCQVSLGKRMSRFLGWKFNRYRTNHK